MDRPRPPAPVSGETTGTQANGGRSWVAAALVVVVGIGGLALRYHNHQLGLLGDDYDFLVARESLTFHTLLQPHWENLSAVGVLIYRALFALVGIGTAVPYIATLLAFVAASAALAYAIARRHLGGWAALAVPILLLTLGQAGEALLWPEFTPISGFALWLAAMLLIARDDRLGDAAGCALLTAAVASHSVAVALLPATATAMLLAGGRRRALKRAWVLGLPLATYLAWYAAYHPHLHRTPRQVPGFVVRAYAATVGDLTAVGVAPLRAILALVVLATAGARIRRLGRVPALTACMCVGLLGLWIAEGLSAGPGRAPDQSRYQFFNAALMLLALAPLVPRPAPAPGRAARVVRAGVPTLLLAAIVTSNLGGFGRWERTFHFQEAVARAQMAVLEIARPAVAHPGNDFTGTEQPGLYDPFTPQAYFRAIAAHGSPVNVPLDLELAPEPVRYWADVALMRLEAIGIARHAPPPPGILRPQAARGLPLQPAGPGCALVAAGRAQRGLALFAPAGGLSIQAAPGPPVGVRAGRFGALWAAIALPALRGGSDGLVATPVDNSTVQWHFVLRASQALEVCSVAV